MIRVYWSNSAERKILSFNSEHYAMGESRDFIAILMTEIESLLSNSFLSKRYIEEKGDYIGLSRVVHRKFKFYYEKHNDQIIILAVKFPGEK